MNKEISLSETGYYDYLIKKRADGQGYEVQDPGVITELPKIGEAIYSFDGGLDYSPAPKEGGIIKK